MARATRGEVELQKVRSRTVELENSRKGDQAFTRDDFPRWLVVGLIRRGEDVPGTTSHVP